MAVTPPPLTDLDLAVIAQWARTRWRVAFSLLIGEPDRPENQGGSLTHRDLFSNIDLPQRVDALWYEATKSRLCVYGRTPKARERIIVHAVTWTTVSHWLNLWTPADSRKAIALNKARAAVWERPDERLEAPACFDSKAIQEASARTNDRLYGERREIELVRYYDAELDQLIGGYLTARQPSLF